MLKKHLYNEENIFTIINILHGATTAVLHTYPQLITPANTA